MATAPPVTFSKRAGKYPTVAKAARAIHADPANLKNLDLPPFTDPAKPTVEELLARKNVLFALLAHFSTLMQNEIETLAGEASPFGLLRPVRVFDSEEDTEQPDTAPVVAVDQLLSASFYNGLSNISVAGDFYQSMRGFSGRTVDVLQATVKSLSTPAQAPLIARAAQLMDELPSAGHERRPDEVGNDLKFIGRNIEQGMGTSFSFASDLLRAMPKAVGRANPNITSDQVIEIARASTGLMRSAAGMNMRQFSRLHNFLRTPLPADRTTATWSAYAQELQEAKDGAPPDLDKGTPGRDPQEIVASHLVPGQGGTKAAYQTGQPLNGWTASADGQLRTVASWILDEFGLPSSEGCPARIEVVPGKLSPLARSYYQMVKHAEHHWRLTIPSKPPIVLSELDPPIDAFQDFSDLELAGLGDFRVRVLPSSTGATSVELGDPADQADLRITAAGGKLSIIGATRAADPETQRTLIIRTPQRANVVAREFAALDIEYARKIDVDMPTGSSLRTTVPLPPLENRRPPDNSEITKTTPPNKVTLGRNSRALFVGWTAQDLKLIPVPDDSAVATFLSHSYNYQTPQGCRTLELPKLASNELQHIDEAGAEMLAGNMDFVYRQTGRQRLPDSVYNAIATKNYRRGEPPVHQPLTFPARRRWFRGPRSQGVPAPGPRFGRTA